MISKKRIVACLCAVLITISLIHPLPARAANSYYVSTTGSDANAGTLAQPFLTISKGIGKLVAGDTLYIRAGTYAEVVSVSKSGTSSAPITISAYPGEHVLVAPQSASSVYNPAISLNGNYINIQNLEATFPNAKGMDIPGSYNKVDNLDIHTLKTSGMNIEGQYNLITNSSIHEAQYQGVFITGSNNTLEGNKIYKNVLDNDCPNGGGGCNGDWPGVVSIGDSGTSGGGSNTVFRGNQVYENYGEGVLCMYNTGVLVEGNSVRDNLEQNIYFDQCSNSTIRNNLVYYTTNHEYWLSSSHPQAGIEFANEGIQGSYPVGHDIKIYNNIVVNNGYGIAFWVGRAAGAAILNTIVANNTLVNNTEGISFDAPAGTNSGSTIENNIVMGGSPFAVGSTSGLTFTHNLYSKTPSYLGAGDIVADPLLVNSGQSVVTSIDPGWYKITSASPAIGKALVLSEVVTDYFGTVRGSSPDIGAHENDVNGPPPATATPYPTPRLTNTPLTSPTPARTPVFTPTKIRRVTPTRTPINPPKATPGFYYYYYVPMIFSRH